jgi:hypothetical protein
MAINYPGLVRGYMIGATEIRMTEAWNQSLPGSDSLLDHNGSRGCIQYESMMQVMGHSRNTKR